MILARQHLLVVSRSSRGLSNFPLTARQSSSDFSARLSLSAVDVSRYGSYVASFARVKDAEKRKMFRHKSLADLDHSRSRTLDQSGSTFSTFLRGLGSHLGQKQDASWVVSQPETANRDQVGGQKSGLIRLGGCVGWANINGGTPS